MLALLQRRVGDQRLDASITTWSHGLRSDVARTFLHSCVPAAVKCIQMLCAVRAAQRQAATVGQHYHVDSSEHNGENVGTHVRRPHDTCTFVVVSNSQSDSKDDGRVSMKAAFPLQRQRELPCSTPCFVTERACSPPHLHACVIHLGVCCRAAHKACLVRCIAPPGLPLMAPPFPSATPAFTHTRNAAQRVQNRPYDEAIDLEASLDES